MTQRQSNQGQYAAEPQGSRSERPGSSQQPRQQISRQPGGETGNDYTGGNQGPSYGGQHSAWDTGGGRQQEGGPGDRFGGQFGGQQGSTGQGASGQWGGGADYDRQSYEGRFQSAAYNPQGRHAGGFDPSGPYGGFGGAGGSQGSLYGDGPGQSHGPRSHPSQRVEHQAWQREQSPSGLHGGVVPGAQGPYGDYGEVQGHHGGYWYGGRESAQASFGGGQDWRQHQQGQGHFDPDYHQWRDAQMRSFDEDYRQWREERFRRFSDEFSQWRQNRAAPGQSAGQGGSGSPDANTANTANTGEAQAREGQPAPSASGTRGTGVKSGQ